MDPIFPLAAALAGYLVKDIFQAIKGETRKNTDAIVANTIAIEKLEVRLDEINRHLQEVPRLRQELETVKIRMSRMTAEAHG